MAPNDPELRARFALAAAEAKRLGLHRHGNQRRSRLSNAKAALMASEMRRYVADGATPREVGDIFGYEPKSVRRILRKAEMRASGEESEEEAKPWPVEKKSEPGREVYCMRSPGESDFGFRVKEMEDGQFIVSTLRLRSAVARAGVRVGDRVVAYKHTSHRDQEADEQTNSHFTRWSRSSLDCINAFPVEQGVVLHVSTARRKRTKLSTKAKPTKHSTSSNAMPSLDDAKQLFRAIDAKFSLPETRKMDEEENKVPDGNSYAQVPSHVHGSTNNDVKLGTTSAIDFFVEGHQRRATPPPPAASIKHEVYFGPGPNKRDVYLVRLDGEQTFGFSVQGKGGRFRISRVDEGGAAWRAGLTVDQWVVSYKLWPMHRVKHVTHNRAFDPWTASTLDTLNSHPINEAIAIKVVAPGGFDDECLKRMEYILHAKTSVFALKAFSKRQGMMNELVIKYDTGLIDNENEDEDNNTGTGEDSKSGQASRTPELKTEEDTTSNAEVSTLGYTDKDKISSSKRKGEATESLKRTKTDSLDKGEATSLARNAEAEPPLKRIRDESVIGVKTSSPERVAKLMSQRKRDSGISSNEGKKPTPVQKAEEESPLKKPSTSLNVSPVRSGLAIEFVQLGQQPLGVFTSALTPSMLCSIQTNELSSDVLMFFVRKMAQFIPWKRLQVLAPNFYQDSVVKASPMHWKRFMAGVNTPVVCLPVFDSGRWVLAVIVSTEEHIVVNYLDPQNPNGYVLPVCSRIAQFIDTACEAHDSISTGNTKPIVVSKAIATTPASHAIDSGLHVVSYIAAIVRALRVDAPDNNQRCEEVITSASYDQIFSRDQLVEEMRDTWTDAMETSVCWGRRETGMWRPCVRLNLRKTTIDPSRAGAGASAKEVAVLFLMDDQKELQWLSARDVQPIESIQESELRAAMWSAAQHALASVVSLATGLDGEVTARIQAVPGPQAVVSVAGALVVAYVSFQFIAGMWKQHSIDRALSKQGLYRPTSTLPILGNTLDVMIYQKDHFHDWMADQSRASGGKPWVLSIVGRPLTIVFTSPEACEDIFKTQFEVFEKGSELIDLGYDFFGDGIIAVDGEEWARQRRISSHLFSMKMLRDVMDEVVIEKTEKLCAVLENRAKSEQPARMKLLLETFTSDVFTKIGFGVDLEGLDKSLDGDVENEHPFMKALESYGSVFFARAQSPMWLWKLKRYFSIGEEGHLKKCTKIVHDLIYEIMTKSLAAKASGGSDSSQRNILTLFVESNGTSNVSEVRDMVMNFFLAGKDTTSFSMSWFIVNMNRYPRVLKKIREEIRTNLPDLGERVPTMEELQKLPYLEAAIKESLRLYMTAVHRTPNRSTTLSEGTFVPFGSYVILSVYGAGRMTSIWGPDADEFRPERFIDETTGKLKVVSPFKFMSFIGGPRQCIGMKFAMLEMKTAMATVLSRFDIETVEDPFGITYDLSLVLPVKGELLVNVRDRSAVSA